MNEPHPVKLLFDQLDSFRPYPDKVAKMPPMLPEFAFFPGGAGLWGVSAGSEWPPIPTGRVMVLGHNFGSTDYYDDCRRVWHGDNQNSDTWTGLTKILDITSIPLEWCFFTNIYVGLRTDGKETGKFPGASNKPFRNKCQMLFQKEVECQKPSLILSLGRFNPSFLSEISDELASWKHCKDRLKLVDLSEAGPVAAGVRFTMCPQLKTVVVALTHPSCPARAFHVAQNRSYQGCSGYDVEIDMVQNALRLSGLR